MKPLRVEDPVTQSEDRRDEPGKTPPGQERVIAQPTPADALRENVPRLLLAADLVLEADLVNPLETGMELLFRALPELGVQALGRGTRDDADTRVPLPLEVLPETGLDRGGLEEPVLVVVFGLERQNHDLGQRQKVVAACPLPPSRMDGEQGHHVIGAKPDLPDFAHPLGQRGRGGRRLVDQHGEPAGLRVAREHGPLPRVDPFLRSNRDEVEALVPLGREERGQHRGEVGARGPEADHQDRSAAVGKSRNEAPSEREDVEMGQILRPKGSRSRGAPRLQVGG